MLVVRVDAVVLQLLGLLEELHDEEANREQGVVTSTTLLSASCCGERVPRVSERQCELAVGCGRRGRGPIVRVKS